MKLNIKDFEQKYANYNSVLSNLKEQCAESEKKLIVAETKLEELKKQKTALVEECEKATDVSLDEITNYIIEKDNELNEIIAVLSKINVNQEITDDVIKEIDALVAKHCGSENDKQAGE